MKRIFALLIALIMMLSLASCGNGGNGEGKGGGSGRTPTTDLFWEKHAFAEEWMLPDGGVYTSYKYIDPAENTMENEAVQVTVYDITEDEIAAYAKKIEEHGYTHLIGNSYSKAIDGKTAMIEIKKYLEDGYIIIIIDPSI